MLIVRIKQAEAAVAGGRLDEAFDLLRRDGRLREHRRGQDLATRLVAKLVDRGRAHLAAGRPPGALADADKAAAVGGNQADVADLRSAAAAAVLGQQQAERQAAGLLAAAHRRVMAGQFSAGERLLAPLVGQPNGVGHLNHETQAARLMDDVAAKRQTAAAAVRAAEAALAADDVGRAVAELAKARAAGPADPRLDAPAAACAALLRRRVTDAVAAGRLDAAEAHGALLAGLGNTDVEAEGLRRAVGQYRHAWELLDGGRLREAEEVLRRAHVVLPGSTWADEAIKHLRQAHDAIDALRAGPFGLMGMTAGLGETRSLAGHATPVAGRPAAARLVPPPVIVPPGVAAASPGGLPSTFLLRVDGVGSFLVLRQPRVTIGPVSASRVPDVGLVADPTLPPVTIERVDDDYFLRTAGAPATVNDRPLSGHAKLLANGDRVGLSPRCRLTFGLPTPASTSAVLDLAGARLPAADVRRVILMDRDLILGPGPNAHVRTDAVAGTADAHAVVLHLRDGGRLCCAAQGSAACVTVDGRPIDRHAGIPIGAHVRAGGVSFVVTAA